MRPQLREHQRPVKAPLTLTASSDTRFAHNSLVFFKQYKSPEARKHLKKTRDACLPGEENNARKPNKTPP